MLAVFLDLRLRIFDRVPMARKEEPGAKRGHLVERAQVRGDVSFRVGDHRAPSAEDEVPAEEGTVAGKPETEMVGAVPGRVEGGHVQRPDADHVLVAKLGVTLNRGMVRGSQALGEWQVIRMGV